MLGQQYLLDNPEHFKRFSFFSFLLHACTSLHTTQPKRRKPPWHIQISISQLFVFLHLLANISSYWHAHTTQKTFKKRFWLLTFLYADCNYHFLLTNLFCCYLSLFLSTLWGRTVFLFQGDLLWHFWCYYCTNIKWRQRWNSRPLQGPLDLQHSSTLWCGRKNQESIQNNASEHS